MDSGSIARCKVSRSGLDRDITSVPAGEDGAPAAIDIKGQERNLPPSSGQKGSSATSTIDARSLLMRAWRPDKLGVDLAGANRHLSGLDSKRVRCSPSARRPPSASVP